MTQLQQNLPEGLDVENPIFKAILEKKLIGENGKRIDESEAIKLAITTFQKRWPKWKNVADWSAKPDWQLDRLEEIYKKVIVEWKKTHEGKPKNSSEEAEFDAWALYSLTLAIPDWNDSGEELLFPDRKKVTESRALNAQTKTVRAVPQINPDDEEDETDRIIAEIQNSTPEQSSTPTTSKKASVGIPSVVTPAVRSAPEFPKLDWRIATERHEAADLKAEGKSFSWIESLKDERAPFSANEPVLVRFKETGEQKYVDRGDWWDLKKNNLIVNTNRNTEASKEKRKERTRKQGAYYRKNGQLTPKDLEVLQFITQFKWIKLSTLARALGTKEASVYSRIRTLKQYRYITDDRIFPYPVLYRATKKGLIEMNLTITPPLPAGSENLTVQQQVNFYAACYRSGLDLCRLGLDGTRVDCISESEIQSSWGNVKLGKSGRVRDGSSAREAELMRLEKHEDSLALGIPWDHKSSITRLVRGVNDNSGGATWERARITQPQALASRERLLWHQLFPDAPRHSGNSWMYLALHDSTEEYSKLAGRPGTDKASRYHAPDLVLPSTSSDGRAVGLEFEKSRGKDPLELNRIMEAYSESSLVYKQVVWVTLHKTTVTHLLGMKGMNNIHETDGAWEGTRDGIGIKIIPALDGNLEPLTSEAQLRKL